MEFHKKKVMYECNKSSPKESFLIDFSRYSNGTKLINIKILKPKVGHEIPSRSPEKILRKKFLFFKMNITFLEF